MNERSKPEGAWGLGLATISGDGRVLDSWYPTPRVGQHQAENGTKFITSEAFSSGTGYLGEVTTEASSSRKVRLVPIQTHIRSLSAAPIDAHDVYLRLHLLSHRLIRPHDANLKGMFNFLATVAWTSDGPCLPDDLDAFRWASRISGKSVQVHSIDKIPRMTDYVVPSGVRIADVSRVRLGAYLSPGTTVMHEGFCNFNAGTLGHAMVEGRISAGVVVGDGSDVGGGASIMGTLSGGGEEVISVGERCLLGANSGIGISLADDCVVEAGCYITAGTRVTLPSGEVVKAISLSTRSHTLFRRHSETGRVEAIPRNQVWGALNTALHSN